MTLDWPDCENVRDLGGLPIPDGRTIRPGALVRADSLHKLTPDGIDALRSYGVVRVIDLRNADEIAAEPNPFADEEIYHFQPMINPEADRAYDRRSDPTLAAVYCGSLTRNASNIVAGVAAIADAPPGAVLVHCSAGKDRTGMIVALVLKTAGVPDEAIAADYAYTQQCLRERLHAMLEAAADSAERERILHWKSAVAPTIRTMLDHVEEHFGGVEAYLRAHGMSADQLDRLRRRLLPG